MKLKTAAVAATDDDGNRIGGPYFLPLDDAAKQELSRLAREFGPVEIKAKEQPNV
jgi:hypothetical protein